MTVREKNLSSRCLRQVSDQGFPLGSKHRAEPSWSQGLLDGESRPEPWLSEVRPGHPPAPSAGGPEPAGLSGRPAKHGCLAGSSDLTSSNPAAWSPEAAAWFRLS